jgi:hypothetical protein
MPGKINYNITILRIIKLKFLINEYEYYEKS